MGDNINWQNQFQRLDLNDSPIRLPRESSQQDFDFQHRLSQPEDKDNNFPPHFESPVTLRYRDSVSSNASSLSRNSTMSSTDTRYFSALGSPGPAPPATLPLPHITSSSNIQPVQPAPLTISTRLERPNTLSPVQAQFQQNMTLPKEQHMIEPTGCFIPVKTLSFIRKSEITRHHYVVPTFAMAAENQADVMKLLFNQTDNNAFKPKEEFERTIPWHMDGNSSLITLSQYTTLGQDNPVSRNYLLGLGQRLGITTICVIVSIEVIGTVYPLLDNLIKAMESDESSTPDTNNEQQSPSWWSRVVLVINQQHDVTDQVAYNQRKNILIEEMPRIQERYRLPQPLSILFLSTQVYEKLNKNSASTQLAGYYQLCCQRILYQMMEKHTLSGRWCSEIQQNSSRVNSISGGSLLNVLTEDDESDSSSDDAIFKTVIDYVGGKKKKSVKRKNNSTSTSPLSPLSATSTDNSSNMNFLNRSPISSISPTLQRRATRRQVQKLHCHDGDDPTALPTATSVRRA